MVMGYTSGGAPFGLTEDEYYSDVTDVNGFDHVDDDEPF
jgi:hypothetical protein